MYSDTHPYLTINCLHQSHYCYSTLTLRISLSSNNIFPFLFYFLSASHNGCFLFILSVCLLPDNTNIHDLYSCVNRIVKTNTRLTITQKDDVTQDLAHFIFPFASGFKYASYKIFISIIFVHINTLTISHSLHTIPSVHFPSLKF